MLKFLPTSLYNVPAVETWLQDQARRGRHATGFVGGGMARFQRGAPRETVYRLEPQFLRAAAPDPEMLDLYAGAGWEYVAPAVENGFYLWRSTRPDAREVHTDPAAEELAYAWLAEKQERQFRMTCAWAFLFFTLLLLMWCTDHRLLLTVIGANAVFDLPLLLLVGVVAFGGDLSEYLTIRGLRRQLLSGETQVHTAAPYRLRGLARRGLGGLVAVMFVCTFVLAYTGTTYGELPDVPVPPAAALGVGVPLEPPFGQHAEGLFTQEWWVSQSASDAYGRRTAGWRAEIYRLRVPLLAGPVLRKVVYSGITEELGEAPARLEAVPFDEARYLRAGDGTQYLAARLDGWVLLYRADVPADLRDHLDAFAERLTERGGAL